MSPADRPPKAPHLLPAAAALLLAGAALAGGYGYVRRAERRSGWAPAAAAPGLARYRALQAAALRRPDLLPIYGSSELLYPDPYHASTLFARRPTGFRPFPVGEMAGCALLHVQKLAAVGPELRGRRVVLSFTANSFRQKPGQTDGYAFNFSRLDANELAFGPALSRRLKRAVARRMLQHPSTLDGDPVLHLALVALADGSAAGDALYLAALPLGRLQTAVLRLQDHWDTRCLLQDRAEPVPPAEAVTAAAPDWAALAEHAERASRPRTRGNPFGFDDRLWREGLHASAPFAEPGTRDEAFRRELAESTEWQDLEVLLRAVREVGARPLLVCTPLHGGYLDHNGVTRAARQAYYDRLRALARAHGVPLVDFADHDGDRYFLSDTSHLSSKGWVYYAYTLDAFYHGRRPLELVPAAPRP